MSLEERHLRIKTWKRMPSNDENKSKDTKVCLNCGAKVEANFCHVCGQRTSVGKLTWKSVKQNIAMLWGMDTRLLLDTLIQLVLRPGDLISNYLNGKRRQSFPPIKMLMIVGGIAFAIYFLKKPSSPTLIRSIDYSWSPVVESIISWINGHPTWALLGICLLMVLPTWFVFMFSPRNPKHTLPEGFFIQAFIATIMSICFVLSLIHELLLVLYVFYYVYAYRQLFGYSLWGTYWRLNCCLIGMGVIVFPIYFIGKIIKAFSMGTPLNINPVFLKYFAASIVLLIIVFCINIRTALRRMKNKTIDNSK